MTAPSLYPLFFEPIYQYRLWGGRRLSDFLSAPLPGDGPIGEAWILSDRDDHPSRVSNGALRGFTLAQLIEQSPVQMLGEIGDRFTRFPLLLKYLDARETLSVQVHPCDSQIELLPPGERGKTEAWLVLEAGDQSIIYAGLKTGTTPENFRQAISDGNIENHLDSFKPKDGDAVFIPAGTVHALGGDTVVFEVQENSDVTFRIYDWGHVEAKTGKPRELHIEQAMACIDFGQVAEGPVRPTDEKVGDLVRELLVHCEHFIMWRLSGTQAFPVGSNNSPRVIVCIEGQGSLVQADIAYPVVKGDVALLPAQIGRCEFRPSEFATVLEIAIPTDSTLGA